jgi:allophanate hydrolase subunit 2
MEISLAAMTIEILREGALAWVGAGAWQAVRNFGAGEVVRFTYPERGARSYLAAIGGLDCDRLEPNRRVLLGQILEGEGGFREPLLLSEDIEFSHTLHVLRGTHAAYLDWNSFLSTELVVSSDSDRMGVRLRSDHPIAHEFEITSEPTDVGIVQMPRSGNPIILGPDGPTIGGYPRVACIAECDLRVVAQLAPGQKVRFEEIDLEEAARLNREMNERSGRLLGMIRSQALEDQNRSSR